MMYFLREQFLLAELIKIIATENDKKVILVFKQKFYDENLKSLSKADLKEKILQIFNDEQLAEKMSVDTPITFILTRMDYADYSRTFKVTLNTLGYETYFSGDLNPDKKILEKAYAFVYNEELLKRNPLFYKEKFTILNVIEEEGC